MIFSRNLGFYFYTVLFLSNFPSPTIGLIRSNFLKTRRNFFLTDKVSHFRSIWCLKAFIWYIFISISSIVYLRIRTTFKPSKKLWFRCVIVLLLIFLNTYLILTGGKAILPFIPPTLPVVDVEFHSNLHFLTHQPNDPSD